MNEETIKSMKSNVVEILYTDACPFWKETAKTIIQIKKELNLTITVKKTKITNEEQAKQHGFLGSPTVRINGVDIDPTAAPVKQPIGYVGCRIYTHEGHIYDYPPKQMIKTALQQLPKKQKTPHRQK